MSENCEGEIVGKLRFETAKKNLKCLQQGKEIRHTKRTIANYNKCAVEKAVDFILSSDNIQVLSWGHKNLTIGNQEVTLPKICRKRIPEYILRSYQEMLPKSKTIGASSFLKLVNAITFNDMKAATAVDYATGILVYDNFDIVQKLVDLVVLENIRE